MNKIFKINFKDEKTNKWFFMSKSFKRERAKKDIAKYRKYDPATKYRLTERKV